MTSKTHVNKAEQNQNQPKVWSEQKNIDQAIFVK